MKNTVITLLLLLTTLFTAVAQNDVKKMTEVESFKTKMIGVLQSVNSIVSDCIPTKQMTVLACALLSN